MIDGVGTIPSLHIANYAQRFLDRGIYSRYNKNDIVYKIEKNGVNRVKNSLCACKRIFCLLIALALVSCVFASCRNGNKPDEPDTEDTSRYLVAVEDEPDTVDFQRTTIYYTIATNVFDRLVEMETDDDGSVSIVPSLAEEWTVSDDGRVYTFRLREGVAFSNGSELTASDVKYTFERLLTFPGTANRDIAEIIFGAEELEKGEASGLEGFRVLGDREFSVTLTQPFSAFLACLSMPGASIMDEDTAREAGERFGTAPEYTVGTGSFILKEWTPGSGMILTANRSCWKGAPKCEGLDLRFMTEPEEIMNLFESGELDILDLDDIGNYAEFFIHGDIYKDKLFFVPRIGVTYIALNESAAPLDDVRVRKALTLALDRELLLDAVYDGMGVVENGIYPHGLYGFDPDIQEIEYSPEKARGLLAEAGLSEGFDLTVSLKASSTQKEMTLVRIAAYMWSRIGVRVSIEVMDESEFMELRKSGRLACYTAMWTADFNDPDNFIYTFFGSEENTVFRSLCYPRTEIMERVRNARTISDPDARIEEYRELERIIIGGDAAWIPLFLRLRVYVASDRIGGLRASWNGSVKNRYCDVTVAERP